MKILMDQTNYQIQTITFDLEKMKKEKEGQINENDYHKSNIISQNNEIQQIKTSKEEIAKNAKREKDVKDSKAFELEREINLLQTQKTDLEGEYNTITLTCLL